MTQRLLKTLLVTFLLVKAFSLTGCTSPLMKQSRQQSNGDEDLATGAFQIEGLRVRVYESDILTTLIEAEQARLDFAKQETRLRKVSLRIQEGSETRTSLEGQEGIMYMTDRPDEGIAKNDVILQGDVVMKHGTMFFELPGVRFNSTDDADTFVSQGDAFEFRLETEGGPIVCRGKTMRANRELSRFAFLGPGEVKRSAKEASVN